MISKGVLQSKLFFNTMIPGYLEIWSQGQLVRTLMEILKKHQLHILEEVCHFFSEKPEVCQTSCRHPFTLWQKFLQLYRLAEIKNISLPNSCTENNSREHEKVLHTFNGKVIVEFTEAQLVFHPTLQLQKQLSCLITKPHMKVT